jgi:hypothetical protein
MNKILLIVLCCYSSISFGQSFAPAAGQPGSTAVHKDSSAIVGWATGITVNRGYLDIADPSLGTQSYGVDINALGMAEGDGVSVVTLGDSGVATLTFSSPIINLEGPDFAVFENGFEDDYMEFAHVEVSSDGINFFRFLSTSETPLSPQLTNFSFGDCRYVNNLAGKYRQGYGTPFDLEELIAIYPLLDVNAITHVRLIDVVGSVDPSFGTEDAFGNLINDPYPTAFDAGGFDLDAIAVLNQLPAGIIEQNTVVEMFPNPTKDMLTIQMNGEGEVFVYSLLGQVLSHTQIDQSAKIDVSQFGDSIVMVEVVTSSQRIIERIVID